MMIPVPAIRYSILLALVAVTLVVVAVVVAPVVTATDAILSSLCANKAVDLTQSSQVKSLAAELEADTTAASACPERVKSALRDLDDMISSTSDNVCSLQAVDRLRDYYESYISSALDAKNEDTLPKSLKNFVLAYGLQVSKLCKKNMINSLMLDSEYLLKEQDHKLVSPWTNEHSLISQLMSEPSDYDDLLLPRDLNRVLEDAQESGAATDDGKMYMQSATGQVIKKMQTICGRRFKPIYEQLILPLIYLSNMGFNYQGEELERELKEMSLNKEVHQWYRIVYLCEPLQDIEIVEDPRDAEITAGTDERIVRILSREEAAKLKAQYEATPEAAAEKVELKGIEQLVYKQEYDIRLGDVIVDPSDRDLMKLVNKFATHKSELQRIRSRLVNKLVKFMMNKLKHGQLSVLGSLMGGGSTTKQNGHEVHSANNEIVSALDEYIGHSASPDGSVAGGSIMTQAGGLAKRYYYKASTDGVTGLGGKAAVKAFNKSNLKWYFWYTVATLLFIAGVVSVAMVG